MQLDIWGNSGAEQPHFPFTGKPGINVVLEDLSNPWNVLSVFYSRNCGSHSQGNKGVC
jgi:hypothetical protein